MNIENNDDDEPDPSITLCLVSHYCFPDVGGVENYMKVVSQKLSKKGINVHVITGTLSLRKKYSVTKLNENLTVHRIPSLNLARVKSTKWSKKFFKELDTLIHKISPDIIELENMYRSNPGFSLSTYLASLKNNIKTIMRVHTTPGSFKKEFDSETFLIKSLDWDSLLCVSNYNSETLYHNGVNVKKLKTIYNPVDTKLFSPNIPVRENFRNKHEYDSSDIIILHASRLINANSKTTTMNGKGIDTLMKSFSLVSELNPNVKLLIAGSKPPQIKKLIKLQEKAKQLIYEKAELYDVKDKVKVLSFEYEEISRAYNAADIFVLSSKREAFGMVFSEAMSCELPIIGSDVGGIPEIIDNGINGYTVPVNSPVELSKRISWLIKSPEKRKNFGREGRIKAIQKFDTNIIINDLINFYKELTQTQVE